MSLFPADPYFDSVVLRLPLDGNDGDTSTTDYSNSNHLITFVGTAQLDTATSVYGSTSLLLDGNSDYITAPDSTDWEFLDGDFTIEFWYRFNNVIDDVFISYWENTDRSWYFGWVDSVNQWRFVYNSSSIGISYAHNPSLNQWYHIATCREGGTMRLFIDGVNVDTETGIGADSINTLTGTAPLRVGALFSTSNFYSDGQFDDVRITKGVARYTGTFRPPRGPYPTRGIATDNPVRPGDPYFDDVVILLPLQANEVSPATYDVYGSPVGFKVELDRSGSPPILTNMGSPAFTVASNFTSNTSGFARSTVGKSTGKYYFEMSWENAAAGTGTVGVGLVKDTVSVDAEPSGSADFWGVWGRNQGARHNGTNTISFASGVDETWGFAVDLDNSKLWIWDANAGDWLGSPSDPATDTGPIWSNLSGTLHPMAEPWSPNVSILFRSNPDSFVGTTPAGFLPGWPAVEAVTAATDVKGTDTTINGTGRLDPTQAVFPSPYSTASYLCDGALSFSNQPLVDHGLNGGDWTVEFWYKPDGTAAANDRLFQTVDGDFVTGIYIAHETSSAIEFGLDSDGVSWDFLSTGVTVTNNVWQHIALVRLGSNVTLYKNGTAEVSTTYTNRLSIETSNNCVIGAQTGGTPRANGGWIDDFRITAHARYTGDFRPPRGPHPTRRRGDASSIVTKGLVAYLDAGLEQSYPGTGTTWYDVSGSNDFTISGVTHVSGNNGYFVLEDGDSIQRTSFAALAPGTGDFTMSAWIQKTELVENAYVWDFGTNGIAFTAGTSINGSWRYYNTSTGISSPLYTSAGTPTTNWTNVAVTRESGTTTVYINNVQTATDTGDTYNAVNTTTNIGRYGLNTTLNHIGKYAAFFVYHRALTTDELTQNHNVFSSRYL